MSAGKSPISEVIESNKLNTRKRKRFSAEVTPGTKRKIKKLNLKQFVLARHIEKSFRDVEKDFRLLMLLWSPTEVIAPDFIVSFLWKLEPTVKIRERWNEAPATFDSPFIFGGVMAQFSSDESYSRVAKALVVSYKHLKLISAHTLMKYILESEAEHPMCGFKSSELIVCGRYSAEYKHTIAEIFSEFGSLKSMKFASNPEKSATNIICTLKYTFATQAYAAKMYLDGSYYGKSSLTKMFIISRESEYEKWIMRRVKSKCIQFLEHDKLVCA